MFSVKEIKFPVQENDFNENLPSMAKDVRIYEVLTSPPKKSPGTASDLKASLTSALQRLKEQPEHFTHLIRQMGREHISTLCVLSVLYLRLAFSTQAL